MRHGHHLDGTEKELTENVKVRHCAWRTVVPPSIQTDVRRCHIVSNLCESPPILFGFFVGGCYIWCMLMQAIAVHDYNIACVAFWFIGLASYNSLTTLIKRIKTDPMWRGLS